MNWEEVCADPVLQDLPYKIELNEWGQIVMTPASNKHGLFQSEIIKRLGNLIKSGRTVSECSINTGKGTKVSDVAWFSAAFFKKHGTETPYSSAPEICIEILSPSNSPEEMQEKRDLYFAAGAKEVWICGEDGNICFYNQDRQLAHSQIVSKFPAKIDL